MFIIRYIFSISSTKFSILAKEICEIFCETEIDETIWYSKYTKEQIGCKRAGGILYNHYEYIKSKLYKNKVIYSDKADNSSSTNLIDIDGKK